MISCSIIRKPADVVRDIAEDPIPDWALQQTQQDEERAEQSRDPYDHGGRSVGSERGQKGSSNAIIENQFIKVTKKEIPESIKIGCVLCVCIAQYNISLIFIYM